MVSKILGVLLLIVGLTLSLDLVGSVILSAVELIGLLAKLLASGAIAYLGYRLVVGARPLSS